MKRLQIKKLQMENKQTKKLIIFFLMILFTIVLVSNTYAIDNDNTIKQQQEEFGIQDFIKSAKQYTGEFLMR